MLRKLRSCFVSCFDALSLAASNLREARTTFLLLFLARPPLLLLECVVAPLPVIHRELRLESPLLIAFLRIGGSRDDELPPLRLLLR